MKKSLAKLLLKMLALIALMSFPGGVQLNKAREKNKAFLRRCRE